VRVHNTFAVNVDDPVRFLFLRKHGVEIFVAAFTIGITMFDGIVRYGCVNEVIFFVVHVYIVDARHGIDDVECSLQRSPVVFEHRLVERPFDQMANIIAVFAQNRFHVSLVYRPENDAKRYEKEKG
jgi:hypothetical protein